MKCYSSFLIWSLNICSITHFDHIYFLFFVLSLNFNFFKNDSLLMDVDILVFIYFGLLWEITTLILSYFPSPIYFRTIQYIETSVLNVNFMAHWNILLFKANLLFISKFGPLVRLFVRPYWIALIFIYACFNCSINFKLRSMIFYNNFHKLSFFLIRQML